MHYLLKPLIRALRTMNDRDLVASIIRIMLFIAGLLDVLSSSAVYCLFDILRHTVKQHQFIYNNFCCRLFSAVFPGKASGLQPPLNKDFPAFTEILLTKRCKLIPHNNTVILW